MIIFLATLHRNDQKYRKNDELRQTGDEKRKNEDRKMINDNACFRIKDPIGSYI